MPDEPRPDGQPDLDLLEYVLVVAPDLAGLGPVAGAVVALLHAGSIRLLDAVVLVRGRDDTTVGSPSLTEVPALAELAVESAGGVLLSPHDVELAAVTLEPGQAALVLLVEDTWARALSDAARVGGARLTAGERITRDRVVASLQHGTGDLLVRGPGDMPLVDQAAQVRQLARLVDRGLLSMDRYDVQRRRVLGS
jgi:hypothetical protein